MRRPVIITCSPVPLHLSLFFYRSDRGALVSSLMASTTICPSACSVYLLAYLVFIQTELGRGGKRAWDLSAAPIKKGYSGENTSSHGIWALVFWHGRGQGGLFRNLVCSPYLVFCVFSARSSFSLVSLFFFVSAKGVRGWIPGKAQRNICILSDKMSPLMIMIVCSFT